ncbi:unnamed protein product [Rotaria sp. Silwood1]|nr:unnamed protein product [Rotaria sp. Silwood1]
MQAEENTDNATMIHIPNWSLSKQSLLTSDLEIRRTRKILVIICGICLFAWLGVINLVLFGFVILILIISGIFGSPKNDSSDKYSTTSRQNIERVNKEPYSPFFCVAIYAVNFILMIIIVKLTFKFSKLIAAKKAYLIQQTQRAIYSII